MQNLLTDFFYENVPAENVKPSDLNLIVSVSAADETSFAITIL